ncbi:Abi family protein [Niallia sp. MER 6]|uniref:Abi family protein n=1 Tax=Niallia sp. MER 6 TaxID=2939567 RepID=UPI0037C95CB0
MLQRINYYRLTAYGHTSKDPHNKEQYLKESTTSKMYSFYEFDRKYGSFGIH